MQHFCNSCSNKSTGVLQFSLFLCFEIGAALDRPSRLTQTAAREKGAARKNRVFSSAWDGSGTVLFLAVSDLLVRLVGRVKELVRLGAVGEAEVVVIDDVDRFYFVSGFISIIDREHLIPI